MHLVVAGSLHFYFFTLSYRKVQMTPNLSLATFCRPNSLFAFCSLRNHVHIRHRRDYYEQKAVVVVKHLYEGCQFKAKRTSTRMYIRRFI